MVIGVRCEAAGVAHLRGEDPGKAPEKSLRSPEASHAWRASTHSISERFHPNKSRRYTKDTRGFHVWVCFCLQTTWSRSLTEHDGLHAIWERLQSGIPIDCVSACDGRQCAQSNHNYVFDSTNNSKLRGAISGLDRA